MTYHFGASVGYFNSVFIYLFFVFAGVNVEDIDSMEDNNVKERVLSPQEEYQETLMFNNAIREIFLNRFVQIFSSYEHFVIQPSQVRNKMIIDIKIILGMEFGI